MRSHIGAYRTGIDTKMTKKDTILLCLECSHFLSRNGCNEGEDKAGTEALYKAAIILLCEDGCLFSRREPDKCYDRDETINELYAYFDFLRAFGMDNASQGIIINAICYLSHKPFRKVRAEAPFQKKQGWLREKEGRNDE